MDTSSMVAQARAALSLAAADEITPLGVAELADSHVGLAAPVADSPEPLLMLVEAKPFFRPQHLLPPPVDAPIGIPLRVASTSRPLQLADVPISIVSWETSANIIVCEATPPATLVPKLGAAFPWRESALVLHLGAGLLIVEITGADRELYLIGEPGRTGRGSLIAVFEVRRMALSNTPKDDAISGILEGLHVQPWLLGHAHRLMLRGTVLYRASAAGLMARLWVPSDAADRDLVREGSGLPARARELVESFSTEEITTILNEALAWVARLSQGLNALVRAAVDAPEEVPGLANAFVGERDDLESVQWVLAVSHHQSRLDAALAELDRQVTMNLSVFAFAPELGDDDRILAVHWQEPEQWWGGLAET